ncbi:MAG: GTP 3',8-cyclase MoaA [Alphaproteobacteria bacterium]|nr:GTP 3',8-cyclase MoaA [Alphaproteobacteria bacterium]MDD9919056.1 GTP 3',8-cyclase MoaA [Alphaproteobacteria bacterium]
MKVNITDNYGRVFPYLRLSVTPVCNYQCTYCLPQGYAKTGREQDCLTVAEIRRLVAAFAGLGARKVRLTGGEPTVRTDLPEIAEAIANVPHIQTVALTTNGYKLPQRVERLWAAGIRHINISIDTLQRERFQQLTGHDRLPEVLAGLEQCLELGFDHIKVNTVLLREENQDEWDDFFAFVKKRRVSWRFIELMRTQDNTDYFQRQHVRSSSLAEKLLAEGWQQTIRANDAGPAVEFVHPQAVGRIGLIQPYRSDFCHSCNRLRVSAYGELQLCLFGEGQINLRPWLQADNQCAELQNVIQQALHQKPEHHYLHDNNSGQTRYLAAIGG